MSGWGNLEGKNTRTGAHVEAWSKKRSPAPRPRVIEDERSDEVAEERTQVCSKHSASVSTCKFRFDAMASEG
eukprot:5020589-Prymnesium_polylepis.1